MFKIDKIESAQYYIEMAMKSMQSAAEKERNSISERYSKNSSTQRKTPDEIKLNKRKDLELHKIRQLNEKINTQLRKISKRFPDFRKIPNIYIELINTADVSADKIKRYSDELIKMADFADDLSQKTEYKIKKAKTQQTLDFIMKKHLGKINSLFQKNKEPFNELEKARKFMNSLPTFQDLYTVAIAGFPNVGKSTLMKNMTGSEVEIQNYPFTTKKLMFSYLHHNGKRVIQLIDTPGLLNRKIANAIEQRAEIVIARNCEKIVFVIDFTESCGYGISEQLSLLKRVTSLEKSMIVYESKTDIYDEEDLERREENIAKLKKYKIFTDSEKLKAELIESYLSSLKKFDPSKVKLIK